MLAFADPSVVLSRTRIVERFLDYARLDTQSDETSDTCPSTARQLELARRLVGELKELGLQGVGEAAVTMDRNGYVLAELPGTAPGRGSNPLNLVEQDYCSKATPARQKAQPRRGF